jgi:rare lipoprotein A
MKNPIFCRLVMIGASLVMLSACGTFSGGEKSSGQGTYKVGQPYQIKGNWYSPREDYSYDETGIASWYGSDFHNGVTANGEVFNMNELTAAHKTLPLPSLARVTNLDNGRSIVVRVNDRGPFSGARIIDVSQRAAQLLGFEQQGTAKVRVQVLADESKAIADAMRHYGSSTPPQTIAAADTGEPLTVRGAPISSVETKQLAPTQTTPEIHQQLVQTVPKQEVNLVPVMGAGKIFIQAGAFTQMDNAVKMQASLSKFGQTSISDIVINGKLFHRVRVGPTETIPQSDALLARVRSAGAANARAVIQ